MLDLFICLLFNFMFLCFPSLFVFLFVILLFYSVFVFEKSKYDNENTHLVVVITQLGSVVEGMCFSFVKKIKI